MHTDGERRRALRAGSALGALMVAGAAVVRSTDAAAAEPKGKAAEAKDKAAKAAEAKAPAPSKALIQKKYKPAFEKMFDAGYATYEVDVASANARRYYDMMYVHNALLNMFEATGETTYLERSLRFMEQQISLAENLDYQGRRNWNAVAQQGNFRYGPKLVPHLLFDMQATTEFARLARLVLTNPGLKATYGTRAKVIYDFQKKHVVDKWLVDRKSVTDTADWLVKNADPTKNARNELDDKPIMFARILMDMDRIAPEPSYQAIYTGVLQGMKARLTPFSPPGPEGTLTWDKDRISAEFGTKQAPDTSHANRHVYAMIDAYRNGKVIVRDDLVGLAKLLGSVMWNQSTSDPLITNYIDGTNANFRTLPPHGNGATWFGWDLLGAFDAKVQTLCDALFDRVQAGYKNPTVDNHANVYARLSLAGSLARNLAQPG